jgi:hypothetical protein
MRYWITIYNPIPISSFNEESFFKAITQSDYHTLCEQYGLSEDLVKPSMPLLSITHSPAKGDLFFFLKYDRGSVKSLPVYRWSSESEKGRALLAEALNRAASDRLSEALVKTQEILGIEVEESQLEDLGLLLAYEMARWAMHQGGGVMFGLDGAWYRLNRFQAFLEV